MKLRLIYSLRQNLDGDNRYLEDTIVGATFRYTGIWAILDDYYKTIDLCIKGI